MPIRLDLSGPFGLPDPVFRVRFPGWEDVVHWQPVTWADPADYEAHRQQQIADLLASPSPRVVSDFARIGQEIDNVQDALVTLSVLGRVTVKLTGRLLPGVGWIATAADVLNVLNVFYPPTPLDVGRWLSSKEKKRRTVEGSKLTGGTYKRRLLETLKTGKVSVGLGEALQILQTTDWLFGVGVVLGPIFGAAQDSLFGLARGAEFELPAYTEAIMARRSAAALFRVDQYFGVAVSRLVSPGVAGFIGLALGSLGVGAEGFTSSDLAYERLSVSWPGVLPLFDLANGDVPGTVEAEIAAGLAPYVGPARAAIASVLFAFGNVQDTLWQSIVQFGRAAAYLGGYRDELPWQVHVDLAVGNALMVGLMKPGLVAGDWGARAAPATERLWWGGALPLVPEAASLSVAGVSDALRERGATAPQSWLAEVPGGPLREFCHALVSTTADELVGALEGPDAGVMEDSGPLWRAAVGMQEVELLWPHAHDDAEGLAYIDAAAELTPPAGEGYAARSGLEGAFGGIWPGVETGWE